ncbi:uncharacterized protein EV422DRAFT_503615 [Fimicolochytrium jonesii]|uniref:uncharacterized protein n=1 Tax=Fimicolochytrium jonesii TaxID=1396493 RepID=UPI0022FECE4B|nr:uncharacterized protein EV422DRAFT_503615 [Fimicolochytrium jonesii]KAI8824806.1 hypothetical protein EV422DRAFT_503615 [Fimicolochytrium jonesii]
MALNQAAALSPHPPALEKRVPLTHPVLIQARRDNKTKAQQKAAAAGNFIKTHGLQNARSRSIIPSIIINNNAIPPRLSGGGVVAKPSIFPRPAFALPPFARADSSARTGDSSVVANLLLNAVGASYTCWGQWREFAVVGMDLGKAQYARTSDHEPRVVRQACAYLLFIRMTIRMMQVGVARDWRTRCTQHNRLVHSTSWDQAMQIVAAHDRVVRRKISNPSRHWMINRLRVVLPSCRAFYHQLALLRSRLLRVLRHPCPTMTADHVGIVRIARRWGGVGDVGYAAVGIGRGHGAI